ncbi:MAG TPA: DMT family transporter [Planctomycetota bacterium]|nr:DMT family transporter [Planctomycetota bacterium]
MSRGRRGALAALCLQTFLAAATYFSAKRALEEIDPWTIAMMRFAIAAAAIALLLGTQARPIPPRAILLRLLFLGVLAVPVNQLLFLEGLARSTPTHAALVYALTPLGVRLLDRLLRKTEASAREWLGLALALAGAILVLTRPGHGIAARPFHGDALILLGMLAWALYTVASKPLVEAHGALRVTSWTLLAGAAVALPFGVPALLRARYASYSPAAWFGALYLGIVTSVVCYGLWTFALERLRTTQVAVFSNLQPPMAALLSWLVLGERISLPLILGGSLVLAGVLLAQLERREPPPVEEPGRSAIT